MYGYPVSSGYKGWVNGEWMLFPTEDEYYEYVKDAFDEDTRNHLQN